MSELSKAILDKVVKPEVRKRASNTIGTIVKYSQETNLADVKYTHPNSSTETLATDIKIKIDNGFCTAGPFPGDKVAISFYENNPSNPIIDKIIDNNFAENQFNNKYGHEKQGSFYPFKPDDNSNANNYEDIKEKPNIDNYNNKNKNSKRIYNIEKQPVKSILKKIEMVDKFREAELGIIHPFNHSHMHIRDNGIIDVFAETNNGLRIDPIEQSINQFANLIRMKTNDLLAFIYNNAIYNVTNHYELNSQNTIAINGKNKITINSDGTLDINVTDKITINGDYIKINGNDIKINANGSLAFKSNNDMKFDAPNYRFD